MPSSAFHKGIFLTFPFQAMFLGLYVFKNAWIAIVVYHFLMLLAMGVALSNDGFSKIFKGFNLPSCFLIGGLCLQAGPVLFFVQPMVDVSSWASTLDKWGLSGWSMGFFMIYFFTVNPVIEESFWRSLLITDTKNLTMEDIFFGAYHSMILVHFIPTLWIIISVAMMVAAAYIWRQLTVKLGGTFVPILTHAAADLSIIVAVVYIATSTQAGG